MKVQSRRFGLSLLVVMLVAGSTAQAGWFGSLFGGRKKSEETLIVTGNYLKSRLLAELVQHHTKHPILLLPNGETPDQLFFIPNKKESLMITRDQFQEFVETFHPKTVVFLGDESYAPAEYEQEIAQGLVISTFRNEDWSALAESVGKVMKISGLAKEFENALANYDYKGRVIQNKPAKEVMKDWPGGTTTTESKK